MMTSVLFPANAIFNGSTLTSGVHRLTPCRGYGGDRYADHFPMT